LQSAPTHTNVSSLSNQIKSNALFFVESRKIRLIFLHKVLPIYQYHFFHNLLSNILPQFTEYMPNKIAANTETNKEEEPIGNLQAPNWRLDWNF
jgi:hypothetical protein